MHKLLPLLFLFGLAGNLTAQITLTADYFPVAGDTLKFVEADSAFASNVDLMTEGGADLAWNLSGAVGSNNFNQAVVSANNPSFPGATLSITSGVTTSFYQSSATSFDLVGVQTQVDLFPGLDLSTPLTPVRPVRRAPLAMGATFTTVTENSITISPDSIPAEVLAEVGDVLDGVDSVRVTTISTRNDEVDAWGTVRLLDNFYPVLREKRTEGIYIRLELQTIPLPFIDVTGTIALASPELAQLVGQQPETVSYLFWNDESKEPILDVLTDEETGDVVRMVYKRAEQSTSTQGPGIQQANVKVYPNPTRDFTTFEIDGLTPGNYRLQLVNLAGRRVAMREFSPFGNQTRLQLNVSELPAGLYLYSLINAQGRRIVTKKLQVL